MWTLQFGGAGPLEPSGNSVFGWMQSTICLTISWIYRHTISYSSSICSIQFFSRKEIMRSTPEGGHARNQDFKKASASAQGHSGNLKTYPCMYYLHIRLIVFALAHRYVCNHTGMCAIWSPPQAPSIFVGRCGLCKANTWPILQSNKQFTVQMVSLSLSLSIALSTCAAECYYSTYKEKIRKG